MDPLGKVGRRSDIHSGQDRLSVVPEILPRPSGNNTANPSYSASVVKKYNATTSIARFWNKKIVFYFKNALCMYVAWSQSYDRELQRQRCKFLQRHG
jgi:hypothetical protein